MNLKVLAAAGALLATQSFAIIGIGGHYAPSFGNKLKGMEKDELIFKSQDENMPNISLKHEGFKGTMQGFGFKLWIDLLPIFDVEATVNFQFGSYDASLFVDGKTLNKDGELESVRTEIPLEIELGGTPFGKANPKFVAMNGDLSITYPITSLPIIRPYIGGGITYYLNSFVLNPQFTSALVDESITDMITEIAGMISDPEQMDAAIQKLNSLGDSMKQKVQDAALDEGLNTSIGGHVLVGMRAKLPIIPIAAYANFKYYFGGDFPTEVDPGHMALELGAGFAL